MARSVDSQNSGNLESAAYNAAEASRTFTDTVKAERSQQNNVSESYWPSRKEERYI